MFETLLDQNFVIGAVVGFAAGALAVIGLLLVFDAFENRRKPTSSHTPPVPMPTNSWGQGSHGRSARADLRSGPR